MPKFGDAIQPTHREYSSYHACEGLKNPAGWRVRRLRRGAHEPHGVLLEAASLRLEAGDPVVVDHVRQRAGRRPHAAAEEGRPVGVELPRQCAEA
eukprot:scaffold123921_cov66-Phaeocystis_antarctica.AAC.4